MNEYLNLPGKELNVPIIQSNNFLKKKTTKPITKDYKFIILCDWFRCFFLKEKKKKKYIYIDRYIYIYIIIIMSCRQHGYPWPSLVTPPNHSSLLAGLQGYIPYPHIAAVCTFELVVLLLLGYMRGSIGVHHWWVRPCFSSSIYIYIYIYNFQVKISK